MSNEHDDIHVKAVNQTLYEAITSILDFYDKESAIKILEQCIRYFRYKS